MRGEIGETCSTHGNNGKCTLSLIGKLGGKIPLGRFKLRCHNNTKMDQNKFKSCGLADSRHCVGGGGGGCVVKTGINLFVFVMGFECVFREAETEFVNALR